MASFNYAGHSHKRLNILTGEKILVSPHRTKRPWVGKVEDLPKASRPAYDETCYLCPRNKRADGSINPDYKSPFAFINDFSALLADIPVGAINEGGLLISESESGICKVICFSPRHDLTLPQMEVSEIENVIHLWQKEYEELSAVPWIKYIQVFENKGEIMGCSNPHPHGQIWASSSIPLEISKETIQQKKYFDNNGRSLLTSYFELELKKRAENCYRK